MKTTCLSMAILCGVAATGLAQAQVASVAPPAQDGIASMRVVHGDGEIPAAPAGFAWKTCIKDQIKVLVPSNWEVEPRMGKNVLQCAASEHLKVSPTEFSGLEVALFIKLNVSGVQTPSEFADKMISNIKGKAQSYEQTESADRWFRYRTARVSYNNDRAIMAFATDKMTGTVIQVILTSPSARWGEIASKGRFSIGNIAVIAPDKAVPR